MLRGQALAVHVADWLEAEQPGGSVAQFNLGGVLTASGKWNFASARISAELDV
jgi:hypothetical protein